MIGMQQLQAIANKWNTKQKHDNPFSKAALKTILLLTDVTVNNCAWNYIVSLSENILYIGRKTMQTIRVYFV